MNFGLMIQPRSLAQTRELARAAEGHGFDWLGVADSPVVYGESYLHQFEALRATERIRVGPLVTHVVIRHPLIVANALSTLSEVGAGRVVAALGTGNSAARGLGLEPASLKGVREAVACMRGWWAGEPSTFGASRVPASGKRRTGCPLLLAADGPRGADLAGEIGDGFVFGGGLDAGLVRERVSRARIRPDQVAWVAPAVSLAGTREAVLEEMGPQLMAMANRALRGDLRTQGVPAELHGAVTDLHERYDYAFHADPDRPANLAAASRELTGYLIDRMVLWGGDTRWAEVLGRLAETRVGVMLVLGHRDPLVAVRAIGDRLERLGYLGVIPASR